MTQLLKKFAADTKGATAVEYGLIAALIAVVMVVAVGRVGNGVNTAFDKLADKMGVAEAPAT